MNWEPSTIDSSQPACDQAAVDFGKLSRAQPVGVVTPSSLEDLSQLLAWSHSTKTPVATQGMQHSNRGQATVANGIVIKMQQFNRIEWLSQNRLNVQAGATWQDVLDVTAPHGLMPAVLPDYLPLSVGGTLSSGGIGHTSFRSGLQIDQVLELTAVTAQGDILKADPGHNPDFLAALLGGVGQYGVLVDVTLPLVHLPETVELLQVLYTSPTPFFHDQSILQNQLYIDAQESGLMPNTDEAFAIRFPDLPRPSHDTSEAGSWYYLLRLISFQDHHRLLDLLPQLNCLSSPVRHQTLSGEAYLRRITGDIHKLDELGLLEGPFPWIAAFIPEVHRDDCMAALTSMLSPQDFRWGRAIIQTLPGSPFTSFTYDLQAQSRWLYIALMRNLTGQAPEAVERTNKEDQQILQAVGQYQGLPYLAGGVLDGEQVYDWRQFWPWDKRQAMAKWYQQYNPQRLLNPRGVQWAD